ncbi:hypothetical protein D1632_02280 [Chryseobacterium nematophagum]|uniref:Lipoprotein n=1 Tax=Chryseobacterium nematophagum TaxID=2305228 RepID=A0A3M7LFF4_9FLAO|nr:hypothetical protein [Chryseobacterium nematophagum]RMZ60825.1 hypothetical protein D1632_02280 [Chryseobacterium nematophagum]
MKRSKIILFFLSLILLSCTKKIDKDFISSNDIFNDITNLKKYDNVQKINADTLIKIKASNKEYIIEGYINKNLNKKTGWWTIHDINKINKVRLQYIDFENKENINQYIFYKNNFIDSVRSKFYSLKKNGNILNYYFHTPKSKESVLSANLYYIILDENNNILKESKIENKINKGHYYLFTLEPPIAKKVMIKSLFSETLNVNDKSLGTNEILTEDLIVP